MHNTHIAAALAAMSFCAASHAQLSITSLLQLLSNQSSENKQKILAAISDPGKPVDCTLSPRPECNVEVEINEFDIGTPGHPEIICTARIPGVSLKGHPVQTVYWTLVEGHAGLSVDIGHYRYHQAPPMIVIRDKKHIIPKRSMETGGLVAQFDVIHIQNAFATFNPLILRETPENRGEPSLCFVGDPKVVNN